MSLGESQSPSMEKCRLFMPVVLLIVVFAGSTSCGSAVPSAPNGLSIRRLPSIQTPPIPGGVSETIGGMLVRLAANLVVFHRENQELLPRNPSLAAHINAKTSMLETPGLINQIFDERRWVEGSASTARGEGITIGAIFPLETMRASCLSAVQDLERYLPLLMDFFAEPFPTGRLELWYGFRMGANGGNGSIVILDEAVSALTNPNSPTGYSATLAHEASHSYIGNEALTQYLELYLYNVARGLGTEPGSWTYTRGWTPTTPSTFGVSVVLDVHHRVGFEVMQRAYRAIRPH